jgi:hypothetical protein
MTICQICNAVSVDIARLAGSVLLRFPDPTVHGSYLCYAHKDSHSIFSECYRFITICHRIRDAGGWYVANGLSCCRPSGVVPTSCLAGVACEAGTAGECQGCFNSSEQKFPVDSLPWGLVRYRHACVARCIVSLTVAGPVQPAFLRGPGSSRYPGTHLHRQRKGSLYRCVP